MINGLMMLFSFFMCRVMIFPILYWWYASVLDLDLVSTILSIPTWVNTATLMLWTPQLFWFNKMVRGSIKIFRQRHSRTAAVNIDYSQTSDIPGLKDDEMCGEWSGDVDSDISVAERRQEKLHHN